MSHYKTGDHVFDLRHKEVFQFDKLRDEYVVEQEPTRFRLATSDEIVCNPNPKDRIALAREWLINKYGHDGDYTPDLADYADHRTKTLTEETRLATERFRQFLIGWEAQDIEGILQMTPEDCLRLGKAAAFAARQALEEKNYE